MAKTLQSNTSPLIPNIKYSGLAGLVYALYCVLSRHYDSLTESDIRLIQSMIESASATFSGAAGALMMANCNLADFSGGDFDFAKPALEAAASMAETQTELLNLFSELDYWHDKLRAKHSINAA